MDYTRRSFLKTTVKSGIALSAAPRFKFNLNSVPGVKVLNPRNKVPLSLIIDDSTCLVNMAYYGIPQFAEVFPENYKQNWRKLPREIPDSFVREFGEWCFDKGVKGKYSVVPYPACTGWVNRFIPGWTKKELENSLNLIREVIVPNWDIHPEMVSHTRVIDLKTGRPYEKATPEYMENWEWSQDKSVDELAAYQAYALQILKDAGLYCEGLTTPGGYAGRNQENLAISTLQSVRDVYKAEIPHYFRNLYTEPNKSVAPVVKYPSDLDTNDPKCVVSIIGCTGDWFGGWDGLNAGSADKFITEDLKEGRMIEVIDSGEPAIMVCHWPGIYFNGEKTGFNIFKKVVDRLHQKYDNVVWMKNSEIARYWAAKELTEISVSENSTVLKAPFAAPDFTLEIDGNINNPVVNQKHKLKRVANSKALHSNSFCVEKNHSVLCFHLDKGENEIRFEM
ncbi:MAG TPA: hypothetical protein VJ919_03420 [Tangfeifania sp.]|nr:hypothetical protein [Tangfeifania sp.]